MTLSHIPRPMRPFFLPALAFAASAVAAQAQTQDGSAAIADPLANPQAALDASVFSGDFLVVGVGAVSLPSYEGSNDRVISPAAGVYGRIGGVAINPRAAGLALDFIPDAADQTLTFNLGPVVRYRSNRTGRIKDPAVGRLGKLDGVIEAGVAVGATYNGLLNPFDQFSVGTDVRWDISGKGSGRVIAPGVTYFTPVSKGQVIGARVGAEFVDRKYANYNYAINAAGSAASGLPQYRARGGFKEWNVGAYTVFDLSGNFLDGGLSVGGGVQYSRLQNSAAETPITSLRGKRSQLFFGGGVGYTF